MAETLNTKDREQFLDETTLNAELAALVNHNQLPQKIALKISEKIRENHLRLTREQLYRLVDRIQTALRSITQPSETAANAGTLKDQTPQSSEDMKRLYDEVVDLKERLQAIEQSSPEAIRGVTGRLVKTQNLHSSLKSTAEQDGLQPLEAIPNDPESIVIVMKWISYIVERIGKRSLPDVLGYYVDIGWISDDVRLDLLNYSKGIIEEIRPETQQTPTSLPTKDHLQSLLFIQKLKGIHLDDRFLCKIDREMERMTKSLEQYPPTSEL